MYAYNILVKIPFKSYACTSKDIVESGAQFSFRQIQTMLKKLAAIF